MRASNFQNFQGRFLNLILLSDHINCSHLCQDLEHGEEDVGDEADLRARLGHVVPVHVLLHGKTLSLLLVALKYGGEKLKANC